MPTYVVLYRFTDEGRKNIKGSVKRAQEIRRENEARGFKVIGHYWTDRQTAGEMELSHCQKKRFQTFESAKTYFGHLPRNP